MVKQLIYDSCMIVKKETIISIYHDIQVVHKKHDGMIVVFLKSIIVLTNLNHKCRFIRYFSLERIVTDKVQIRSESTDLILEALSRMDKPFVLAVAGRKEINHPKVLNLGYRENMPALYAAADASILASKYEAFGLVGPESICCGTPVLFADTIGAVEVLSQPACFRFSRTVESLCVTLETVYAKFRAGTLPVEKPDTHIHYPYSLHAYLDEIIRMIQL